MSVIYRLSPYFMVSVRQRSFTSLTPVRTNVVKVEIVLEEMSEKKMTYEL